MFGDGFEATTHLNDNHMYLVKITGLASSNEYSLVAVCEILEVFTLSLVWVTAILYFRHLIPRKYTTTGQALPVIAHFCLGK